MNQRTNRIHTIYGVAYRYYISSVSLIAMAGMLQLQYHWVMSQEETAFAVTMREHEADIIMNSTELEVEPERHIDKEHSTFRRKRILQDIDQIDTIFGDDYFLEDDVTLTIDSEWDTNTPIQINPMAAYYRDSLTDTIITPGGTLLVIDNPQSNAMQEPFIPFDVKKDLPSLEREHRDGASAIRRAKPLNPKERRKRQSYMLSAFQDNDQSLGVSVEDFDMDSGTHISIIATAEDYSDIRITFYTDDLASSPDALNYPAEFLDTIINTILPGVSELWTNKLTVIPVAGNLIMSGETCGDSVTIPPEHNTIGISDTDLIVYVVGEDCNAGVADEETLIYAYGGPCEYDQFYRPTAGYLIVCLDSLDTDSSGTLSDAEISQQIYVNGHEMGHILGFLVELFEYYIEPRKGTVWGAKEVEVTCTDGTLETLRLPNNLIPEVAWNGLTYYTMITHQVKNIGRSYFDCDELEGIRLSADDGYCLSATNWHARFVRDDIMSPPLPDVDIIPYVTAFTLGALESSGWYLANFANADTTVFAYNKGCDFITEPCIIDGEIPSYSENVFCNNTIPFVFFVGNPDPNLSVNKCDVTYQGKSMCDLQNYDDPLSWANNAVGSTLPPSDFQYFPDSTSTAVFFNKEAEYCPMSQKVRYVDCENELQEADFAYDTYGEGSRCFNTDQNRSVCMKASCNSVTKKIEGTLRDIGQSFTCEYDGEAKYIETVELQFFFFCPPLKDFCPEFNCPNGCSGRGVCNSETQECVCNDDDETDGCYLGRLLVGSTEVPSLSPSSIPSAFPTSSPTTTPSLFPTDAPSSLPSCAPSFVPTQVPTIYPTIGSLSYSYSKKKHTSHKTSGTKDSFFSQKSAKKKSSASISESSRSNKKSYQDISTLTVGFGKSPDYWLNKCIPPIPSAEPSISAAPTISQVPSSDPTISHQPSVSFMPTSTPSTVPSINPTISQLPSIHPTISQLPTTTPSSLPTINPSISFTPSLSPTSYPTLTPSSSPTSHPTTSPSQTPTLSPTISTNPSISLLPSIMPSIGQSVTPSSNPSRLSSTSPSREPSKLSSSLPSEGPTVA